MPMQCQSNIFEVKSCRSMSCNASQGIRNCYNHCLSTFANPWFIRIKLVDIGGSWFQPHCDFDWFSTSTCDMASVSRGNLSSKQRLPRPMSTQCLTRLDTWRTALPSGSVRMSISVGILLEFCWNSVGDSHWCSHFPRDFDGFPKISRRPPEAGHAVFPDANKTKGTARWIQRRLCA